MTFDYTTPAELFMAKRKGGSRQPLVYRCFPSAAEAIRFAVEEFPAVHTLGVWLQVGDERFTVTIFSVSMRTTSIRCNDKIECKPSVGRAHLDF